MKRTVVAVALVMVVVLAGCSAVNINRPADEASNVTTTDAAGGPGAPTEDGENAMDETTATESGDEQAAAGETTAVTDEASTADPTPTPEVNRLELTNDGEREYVVSVTVTKGPIEAVKLDRSDGSTDIVVLDDRTLDEVLTFDTLDVRPIEVVRATEEYDVDAGASFTRSLPGEERRYVLVEVREEGEDGVVVGGAVLSCAADASVDELAVTADGEDVTVQGECVA
ncbi:hypothetical protein [Halomarina oriensis]|uniref:Uncharacterized protein n=1 Tax=Halomarina oriensis TaxID=671145 RepID=A0A6B0GNP1_9EURY|nr:hypothetical protein [Halomarina oriensis]MWG35571.1 hypothetical protein [Halomarina oriensis]